MKHLQFILLLKILEEGQVKRLRIPRNICGKNINSSKQRLKVVPISMTDAI